MGERKKAVEDIEAEAYEKDRRLDSEMSSENPDRVETFNRRADRKRERYSRDNYYESQEGSESDRKAGPG